VCRGCRVRGGWRGCRGVERPFYTRVRLVREKGESGAVVPVEGDAEVGCRIGLSAAVSVRGVVGVGRGGRGLGETERDEGRVREYVCVHLPFAAELLSRMTCAREAEEAGITIVYWFRSQAQVPKRWVRSSIVLNMRSLGVQWNVLVRASDARRALMLPLLKG